ncbi:hypothetical protein M0813_03348 [Anaeramoeba flamelloides]|uniref:Uncharacterized protein n=1 Tax=Anaeramoeba flamelloides TaxID=1746091 RepID=A0ABQ8Y1G5_9EUKA|nr:hypothetical protein M0813_03348 [Anaeramoeba flamelloides]
MNTKQQKNLINKNQKPTYRDLPSFQSVLFLSRTDNLETSFVYQRMPKCSKHSNLKHSFLEFKNLRQKIKKVDNKQTQSPRLSTKKLIFQK